MCPQKPPKHREPLISVIVPCHNEGKNIPLLFDTLTQVFKNTPHTFEILFVNDGSEDDSQDIIDALTETHRNVKSIEFSRNFGKEMATTAGIHSIQADAAIMMDSDFQHPPNLIPDFIAKWEAGADVVIGVRKKVSRENFVRRLGGILFYKIINRISDVYIIPQGTDFRLLDRKVVDAFKTFNEHNRLTRGLIDWLGFRREYIYFDEPKRLNGQVAYSTIKLFKLAIGSFVSHSFFPLKLTGYLGIVSFFFFGALGFFMILVRIFNNPWGIAFSGSAELSVVNGFLISIVLIALGVIALYLGNVHEEVARRPMYIIRSTKNL